MAASVGNNPPIRLAVLISGAGTNLANILACIQSGDLPGARIDLVIGSRSDVLGVAVARDAGLPLAMIRRRDFSDDASFSAAITDALARADVQLVLMAGFLCFWRIPPRFRNRVLNIHPAILPAFGGKGMYGRSVHEAVLAAGARESGCTVHIADNEYDHGPIVGRRTLSIAPDESVESLTHRVAALERELYPAVLRKICSTGLDWLDRMAVGAEPILGAPTD